MMTELARVSRRANNTIDNARVLLLGVGGTHGKDYKLGLVKKLREFVSELVVVEMDGHWANDYLRDEIGVDDTKLLAKEQNTGENVEEVVGYLEESGFSPNAVVTFRQEWLELRSYLARTFGLPGPPESAVEVARNKYKTKLLIGTLGLEVPALEVLSYEDLRHREPFDGYSLFIRPTVGIRSEWARAISSRDGLLDYVADLAGTEEKVRPKEFLVEPLLLGHEVDVDLVLYQGSVIYGKTSDNFPVRLPFALETGHLMPSILPNKIQQWLVDVASRAVLGCGFRDGNIHAELIVLPDNRVFVVEINGRLGGMYIADWHYRVWGVDLVLAELAVSLGQSPEEFLHVEDRGLALAQVCLCAPPPHQGDASSRSVFFDPTQYAHCADEGTIVEGWYPEHQEETLSMSGPLNLGALTVSGRNSIEAFDSLVAMANKSNLQVTVNGEAEAADLMVLARFCKASPMRRYIVREFEVSDAVHLQKLLEELTLNAIADPEDLGIADADPGTTVLCAVDELRPARGIVGTISVHFWKRLRPGKALCAYLHDLVVSPQYRRLGIAHQLVSAAVELAQAKGCYKAHLDSDRSLRNLYETYGFVDAGDCMVRYFR